MKRVAVVIFTNIAVMAMLSIVVNVLGLNRYLTPHGINLTMLLATSAVIGFGGAFISLMMSKTIAKWSMGLKLINEPADETERWLKQTVHSLADKAGIAPPEVAIYEGAPNAFATGPSRNNSLVAVSTGLLQSMNREQVTAVLGHEVAHIDNGDMVTLTLVQGILNTFVYFLATIVGHLVDTFLRSRSENSGGLGGMGFYLTQIVAQIVFGLLASLIVAYVSRRREFRADAGSARLNSASAMISALENLAHSTPGQLSKNMAAFGIAEGGVSSWFASHPSMESRIAALRGYK